MRLRGGLDSHKLLELSHDAGTCQQAKVPVVRVRLDGKTVLPAVQRCFAEPGHLGKSRPCHPKILSDAPDLGRWQNAKMPAHRFVLQTLGRFIEVFELAGIAPAHRDAHRQLDGGIPGSVVECVTIP